ncbi:PhzF family phenazine biosynthesis protein [uncultured Vibrio sp.]|uniref:PhzF family phenazine biosynthesis protein n=1 Tax=uncultured Vibrio sp. TaxID=114054 RepID=UPI0025FC9E49|nr:PhzF family phenazine biosynthesis protein [uncultured Vibrio sp.]
MERTLGIYVVDAFSDEKFKGNSAAVVPLDEWLEPELMQNIASENNLSETAFIKHTANNTYQIRWFSPLTEIDFCGHATLAASFVLFNHYCVSGAITFETTKVGELSVVKNQSGRIEMNFPNQRPKEVADVPDELYEGLSIKPVAVLKNRQAYIAVLASEDDVRNVCYNSEQLKKLAPFDVAVTSASNKYDFVSRYFWPANGGDEDPVTGSIHSGLAPMWAEKLNRNVLVAHQASKRGGVLYCEVDDDRVSISGYGVLYLQGKITV